MPGSRKHIKFMSLIASCGLTVLGWTHALAAPDLETTLLEASPGTLLPDDALSLTVLVSNVGDLETEATTLRFVYSDNATIELSDTEIGSELIPAFQPDSGQGKIWDEDPDLPAGTYWVGACVDPVAGDTNPTNDCSEGFQVVVPDVDFLPLAPGASPSRFPTGFTVSLQAVVDNRGSDASGASTIQFKLSNNALITSSDSDITTLALPALSGGERWIESVDSVVSASPGTWWIGVCVDPDPAELSTDNNCSQGTEVEILSDELPDLVISSVAALPDEWFLGEFTDLFARVTNQGLASSGSSTVRFYLSNDSTISAVDDLLGTVPVDPLGAGSNEDTGIFVDPQPSPGTYWIGACVDTDGLEFNDGNNCSSGVRVSISRNTNACADLPLSCGVTVSGSLSSADCDDSPRGTGYWAKQHTFQGVAGETRTFLVDWSGDGYLYLESPSGSVVAENDDGTGIQDSFIEYTLNTAGEWTLWTTTFQAATNLSFDVNMACEDAPAPDLTANTPALDPGTITSAETLNVVTAVNNIGGGVSSATSLKIVLSEDNQITAGDAVIATRAVSMIDPGADQAFSIDVIGPVAPGTWYIGACVESLDDEANAENNCSPAATLTVNENVTACVSAMLVCGETVSGGLSAADCDDSPRGPGHFSEYLEFNALAGEQVTIEAAWSGDGYLYLVDPQGAVVAENDNDSGPGDSAIVRNLESAGTWTIWTTTRQPGQSIEYDLTLQCDGAVTPDLSPDTPVLDQGQVEFGDTIHATVNVRNLGTGASSGSLVSFVISEDNLIDDRDQILVSKAIPILQPGGEVQRDLSFPALYTAGQYWIGACTSPVAGDSNPGNDCSGGAPLTIEQSAAIPINAGLNEAWYNPLTAGQGFFITVYPEVGQIFMSWFTYDTVRPDEEVTANLGEPGHRWITAIGPYEGSEATLDVWVAEGGVFNERPPIPVQRKDGTINLSFPNCKAGIVSYEIESLGLSGEVAVQRQLPDNIGLCEALVASIQEPVASGTEEDVDAAAPQVGENPASEHFVLNEGLNDAWYWPTTDGQGYFLSIYPETNFVFLAWFTYDTERPPESVTAELGEPGHRWVTAQGSFNGNVADLTVYVTEGGLFDQSPPAPVTHADGVIELEFTDCAAGTVTFDIPSIGQQGTIPIQRVVPDNQALCEEIRDQAEAQNRR